MTHLFSNFKYWDSYGVKTLGIYEGTIFLNILWERRKKTEAGGQLLQEEWIVLDII